MNRWHSKLASRWLLPILLSVSWWSQRALAQSSSDGGDGGSGGGPTITSGMVAEALVEALKSFLKGLFSPIEGLIETHANSLLRLVVGTPHPDAILDAPTGLPWTTLYDYYWDTIVPLALLLFGLAVGLVILLETTSHLFSGYHRTNLKRRAFSGLLGVLSWWWLAALSLQVTDQLVTFLVPDLSSISLFQTISFGGIGLLGLVASLSVDATLFGLLALLYLGRRLLLYGFVLGMPLLIVAWIPGVGPFSLLSRFAKRLAGFYVPFLLMPVPVALLLRLGALLGDAATLSMGGLGAWLTALVIPFVAVVSPFVLIWQAGGLLFVGDRLARRASRDRLRSRMERGRDAGRSVHRGGHDTLRSLREQSVLSGATTSGSESGASSGPSRRQLVQRGLRSAPSRLGNRFRADDTSTIPSSHSEPIRFEPNEYETRSRTNTTTDDRTER